jgi:hypothetical protein
MKTVTYKPYKGGAGPTVNQSDLNTQALFQAAKAQKIKCGLAGSDPILYAQTGNSQTAVQVWDTNNLSMWVSYDRWGFCASCETAFLDDLFDLTDQMDLETAITLMIQFSKS